MNNVNAISDSSGPFTSPTTQLTVNVKSYFFNQGWKYAFYLDIMNENMGQTVTVTIKFIITINNIPQCNIIV